MLENKLFTVKEFRNMIEYQNIMITPIDTPERPIVIGSDQSNKYDDRAIQYLFKWESMINLGVIKDA